MKKSITVLGVATAVAVPASLLVATPAHADVERQGRCSGAVYELNVDKERGRFEVDGGIDNARPGSRWRVALVHDGKVVVKKARTADYEGEISVDRLRPNTAGKDVFRFSVTKVGSGKTCSVRIVTR